MAQFKFKLQPVLRQRELVEQQCQRDLAVVDAERQVVANELKRLDETVRTALADLRQNQLVGEINLSFLAAHRRFMLAMQRQGVLTAQRLAEAQKKVDVNRMRLSEAAKQRRMIEKLREHQQTTWVEATASQGNCRNGRDFDADEQREFA